MQIEYISFPWRTLPENGRDEKSKTPDQGASRSNPALELPVREWIEKTQKIRENRDQDINRALQREALGSLADHERQAVDWEYVCALEAELRKYAGKDHK